ncbi:hypothetical protein B0T17DRAFT_509362 [Bombardia bombarda]|uniref:NB-ARC domain-containing protein n=1 Tax=Bombardia bombarda TaxID=252184 RepID=A0AA39WUX5_9PEZI|nr:hypothetical protein B0T17DRAFT_509362 [Bombardia bombarda]
MELADEMLYGDASDQPIVVARVPTTSLQIHVLGWSWRIGTAPNQECKVLKTVVISGPGGMGKTEIAIQYASSATSKFDAIFWVNADTNEKLDCGHTEIARALDLLDKSSPNDDVACREIVKAWLSKPLMVANQDTPKADEEASWLLILDNLDDLDELANILPDTGEGCVIVTTRNPPPKGSLLSPTLSIDLGPFEPGDASKFLLSLSRREHEANSLELCTNIAKIVGGLPLALTQIGSTIRRSHLKLEEFLAIYTEDSKAIQDRHAGLGGHHRYTAPYVWMLEVLSKPSMALLRVLSFLDPDRIQESILFKDTKNVKLPDYPDSESTYTKARTELVERSLVSWDTQHCDLRIHRLVQDAVRERLSNDKRSAVFEATITLLSNSWPFISFDDRNHVGRFRKCEQLFPHIEQLRAVFGESITSGEFKPTVTSAALFNEVAWNMIERAHVDKVDIYASLAFDILENFSKEMFQEDETLSRLLSQSHQYKAVSCIETNSPGALAHLRCMIVLITERLEKWNRVDDAVQLADAYNESAMAYMRDKFQEQTAIMSWLQSYDAFEAAIQGDMDPIDTKIRQEWPAIHLAIMYSLRGECEKGESILLPVLNAREEKFGKDSVSSMVSGKVLHALGNIRRTQGASDEAIDLYRRALRVFRSTIGDNHYVTADACYCLAERLLVARPGMEQEAILLLDQSLKVYGDIRWYKPQTARSAFMKGNLLKRLGNTIEGEALLAQAMQLRSEIVPDDKRTADQLSDVDFDKEVYYYSR